MKDVPEDPTTFGQRAQVAKTCSAKLSLTMPMVVDDMEDSANQSYRGWPERIYVIEKGGKIAWRAGLGPWGFDPKSAEKALQKLLGASGQEKKGGKD